jgi:hypothetical protein
MYPKQTPKQETHPLQAGPFKPALSMRESEQATGLGHVSHNAEVQSRRLKTYKVGRRRFTTPEWIREWQADRTAETEQTVDNRKEA